MRARLRTKSLRRLRPAGLAVGLARTPSSLVPALSPQDRAGNPRGLLQPTRPQSWSRELATNGMMSCVGFLCEQLDLVWCPVTSGWAQRTGRPFVEEV